MAEDSSAGTVPPAEGRTLPPATAKERMFAKTAPWPGSCEAGHGARTVPWRLGITGKRFGMASQPTVLAYQVLLDLQTEHDRVADLSEALQHLRAKVGVLNEVLQVGVVVLENACNR